MKHARVVKHPKRTAYRLFTAGLLIVFAWTGSTERAAAGQVDHKATQAGYATPFFAETSEERFHELSRTLLEINNDLGVDLEDPNSREALGEIMGGYGLEHFHLIFDRLSSHWSAQLLPITDSQWQMLDGELPRSRNSARQPERFNSGGIRSGGGGGTSAGRGPALDFNSAPEPTTFALIAAGGLLLTQGRRAVRH